MRHISLVSQEVRQIVNQISELDLSASAKTVGGAFAVAAENTDSNTCSFGSWLNSCARKNKGTAS